MVPSTIDGKEITIKGEDLQPGKSALLADFEDYDSDPSDLCEHT